VYEGESPEVFEKLGINVLTGDATFLDNHQIEINGRKLTASRFILAMGSSASFLKTIFSSGSLKSSISPSFIPLPDPTIATLVNHQ
jgi:pyruvate/2-oxoglutarate dehydrogenase complex dihydrolipoamide dehydrogenase (E3) component